MSMPKMVFIDTEFTDFANLHLISLSLVADSGEEFYAEVPYPDGACSEFVRETVLPLLGRYPNAQCSKPDLGSHMIKWLNLVRNKGQEVDICFDSQIDWDLFAEAMGPQLPAWTKPLSVSRNINELLRFDWHKKNKLPEHHALYDAQANRYAYRPRPPVTTA